MLTTTADLIDDSYLNGYALEAYLDHLRDAHPEMHGLLSRERCREAGRTIAEMNGASWEFEDERSGGRGSAYNVAQKNFGNRRTGMVALLDCFANEGGRAGRDLRVLDVLGGDGTVAELCADLGPHAPTIYTADISRFMVSACDAKGFPAIRQSATGSLFRDDSLDGVLIAYGSHHLDGTARSAAVREAFRTLKVGGRLVLHDFETGGPCANWFETVVHPYSRTGHPHPHFSREEMQALFERAGFEDIRVAEISDPFTLHGRSPDEARCRAIMHMHDMYDLIRIAGSAPEVLVRVERLIEDTLGPIAIREDGAGFVAEISRQALVAVGTKPDRVSALRH